MMRIRLKTEKKRERKGAKPLADGDGGAEAG